MPVWSQQGRFAGFCHRVLRLHQARRIGSVQAKDLRPKRDGRLRRKLLVTLYKPNGKFTLSSKVKKMKAVEVHETGGIDKLILSDVDIPPLQPNEVLVRNIATGVNFIDTYHRSGLYKKDLPFTLGTEGAGEVVECGATAVTKFKQGDRVAYVGFGSYSQYSAINVERLVKIPRALSYEHACAGMIQGMTAHYLAFDAYSISDRDVVVVQAAAGGTGQLLVQMAKIAGATVIGSSSSGKRELALSVGCDHVCGYDELEEKVKEVTNGDGVKAVYDGVGLATWKSSLNCVATRGTCVWFGNASGPVPPIDPLLLSAKSVRVMRPTLFHYISSREELEWRSGEVFNWIVTGKLKLVIDKEFALKDVVECHEYLEAGKTTGKLLLRAPHPK